MMEQSLVQYNDEISVKDVVLKLKQLKIELVKNWKTVLVFGVLFTCLGFIYSLKQEVLYEAEITFVVEDSNSSNNALGGLAGGLAGQLGFDLGMGMNSVFSENNVMRLIVSRRVVENALLNEYNIDGKKQSLVNYHIDFNNFKDVWVGDSDLIQLTYPNNREDFTFLHDSIMGVAWRSIVENVVSVEITDENTNIISVKCQSKNENFAKLLTESLVYEMSEYYIFSQTVNSRRTIDFLQHRADSALVKLKNAELDFAIYKDSHYGVVRAEGLLEEIRLKREVELASIMYTEIIKNLEISKVTLLNQKPLINIIDSPIYPLTQTGLSTLKLLIIFAFIGVFLSVIYIFSRFFIIEAIK